MGVEGEIALSKKLAELGHAAGGKALRGAVSYALTPVKQEYQRRIPKGTRTHKTYKGRVVAPGFASRNIVKSAKMTRDKTKVQGKIGVRAEAFYITQFSELGTSKQRARPELRKSFRAKRGAMLDRLNDKLEKNIKKAAKSVS